MTLGLGTSLSTTTPNSADVLHIATHDWLPRPLLAGNCEVTLSPHVMVNKATGLQRWASQCSASQSISGRYPTCPPPRAQMVLSGVSHPSRVGQTAVAPE